MSDANKLAISVSETAEILGLSVPTVYKLIRVDGFPAFKVGSRTLISYYRLMEWVERQAGGEE